MRDIKCPCGLRGYMEEEDCSKTPCDACCPLAGAIDLEGMRAAADRLTAEEFAALARAAIGGGLL